MAKYVPECQEIFKNSSVPLNCPYNDGGETTVCCFKDCCFLGPRKKEFWQNWYFWIALILFVLLILITFISYLNGVFKRKHHNLIRVRHLSARQTSSQPVITAISGSDGIIQPSVRYNIDQLKNQNTNLMGQILFFIFSLIDNGFLLLLEIYLCVTPRLGAQFLLISLLFISGHWWLSLSNIPLLMWFIYEKMTVPKNNSGVYDLLEIYSRNGVQKHMLKSLLNISWLLVALSFNMYFAMQALLFEDEMQEEQLIKWNNTEY